MPDTKWTPERIRAERSRRGLTQAQFGKLLWPDRPKKSREQHVGKWERGQRTPDSSAQRLLDLMEEGVI